MAKRHWCTELRGACKVPRSLLGWWYEIAPRAYLDRYDVDPDRYCSDCAKAARLALTKESAPKPKQPMRTGYLRCTVKGCGSYAVSPGLNGRDESTDLDLCDVCYWRKRAPEPRPISEAPKDGSMVLICVPGCDPMWTIGVFDARQRWVDLCLATGYVNPTHFMPLPPSPDIK